MLTYPFVRLALSMKRGPKNLQINFSSKNLTHFGGCICSKSSSKELGCVRFSLNIRTLQRNNRYTTPKKCWHWFYPIALGLGESRPLTLKTKWSLPVVDRIADLPNPAFKALSLSMAPLTLLRLRKLHDRLLSPWLQTQASYQVISIWILPAYPLWKTGDGRVG